MWLGNSLSTRKSLSTLELLVYSWAFQRKNTMNYVKTFKRQAQQSTTTKIRAKVLTAQAAIDSLLFGPLKDDLGEEDAKVVQEMYNNLSKIVTKYEALQ